ncbi:hypothetical protein R9C00_11730 [Flammeovirgaceae bacterium SG7u.111]|nr:hypothetical protein [Flammeovirgaceae bacterium SG7u.132]WPO38122.1 hypothetical protein R9C00_11730 [Flammeovirgaceae bacterium SG7u.111]
MKQLFSIAILIFLLQPNALGQEKKNLPRYKGQLSGFGSYSPDADPSWLFGGRYIPELSQEFKIDSTSFIDYEVSANMFASATFSELDSINTDANIQPYRAWARYSTDQFELRVGLQKINFGSAAILRPLMWFDEIDPRDPLQLTNGVYGALARYYFLNNANIWLWGLYGKTDARGWDVIPSYKSPEFGGRLQYPVPNGEIAATYHHRTANAADILGETSLEQIPENRYGLDGKWDIGIGLWFEASWIHRSKNLNLFTNHTMFNLGMDYTFALGNGLNVVAEHLVNSLDEKAFALENKSHITASTLSYPMGMFDNLTTVAYFDWTNKLGSFFLNYQHTFSRITTYVMAFYIPDSSGTTGIQDNNLALTSNMKGPGVRFMLLFDH